MKIYCECGIVLSDGGDYLSYKGHVIPDRLWFDLQDSIDDAIEKSGPTPKDKEAACMKIRRLLVQTTKTVWQCYECGTLHFWGHDGELDRFVVADQKASKRVLQQP